MIPQKQIKVEWWKTSKDGSGNNTEDIWQAWHLWADVEFIGGGRTTANGVTVMSDTAEFRLFRKFNMWPTGNFRIVYEGQRFSPQNIGRDQEKKFYWIIQTKAI